MKNKIIKEPKLTEYQIDIISNSYKFSMMGFNIQLMVQDLKMYRAFLARYKDNFISDYGIEKYKLMLKNVN